MTLNGILFALCTSSQLMLMLILVRRRLYRIFPVLSGYLVYLVISDPVIFASYHLLSSRRFEGVYVLSSIPDYVLQTGIILEVVGAVAMPLRRQFPRMLATVMYLLISCSVLMAMWASSVERFADFSLWDQVFLKWNLAFSVFRVVALITALLVARVLGVAWQTGATRIALGFSIYAAVALTVQIAHEVGGFYSQTQSRFMSWEQAGVAAWAGSLFYLVYYLSGDTNLDATLPQTGKTSLSPKVES